jgi:DNA recombination protein RmuC
MDLLVIGFLVGGVLTGALAWVVASIRGNARLATARAQVDAAAQRLAAEREAFSVAQRQMADRFQTIASESLRASQQDFLTLAAERLGAVRSQATTEIEARHDAQQKAIEGLVAPVRASLDKMDEQIRTLERERGTAYGALHQQMKTLAVTQDKLLGATGSLVSALKAPAVRGRWGEIQLRRVVELAGMLEHCDFDQQVTAARPDGDGRLRPDMVVRLPGGRNIVVDAKVPLAAYLEAREAPDDETRTAKLRQHASQVQAHVGKLAAKSYWEGFASRPELVLMFVPAEPLYSVALEQMPGLLEEGFAQGVLIATPSTLLALLRAMSLGWREERLAENAQRISDEGRKLHERVATVLEHLADLGRSIGQSVKHFNHALASFNGRVTVSARRLEELDVRGKKPLVEPEEVDVRPNTVKLADAREPAQPSAPREPARRQLQQPLLSLTSPAANDDA